MIDVKTAVRSAAQFVADIFKDEDVRDIRLEEVELEEAASGPPAWRVTLSFLRSRPTPERLPWSPAMEKFMGPGPMREVKVVRVRDNGEVVGMKQWLAT